jgi:hypothetical protein
MSTLTYTRGNLPAAERTSEAAATEQRPGFWRRVFDRMVAAQQRRAEREIAAYLEGHGGLLTDDMEREIGERLAGRKRSV